MVSFFKSFFPERTMKLSEVNQKQKMAELILGELTWQMKIADQLKIEKEREEKLQKTGVDYSWLVNNKAKATGITEFKRFELEELCYQIEPDDCTNVIRSLWRLAETREWMADEFPELLRTILLSSIHNRNLFNNQPIHNSNTFSNFQKWSAISFLSMLWGGEDNSRERKSSLSLEMMELGVESHGN